MPAKAVIRARIDEETKEEARTVLASMGLTLSDAFRMMIVRIAREKAMPFTPLIPNAKTIRAMKQARSGRLASAADAEALITRHKMKN